jgi:hypothetical protein
MLFPPFALFACCAAAALAKVAANPPFFGAAVLADAGVGVLLEPAAGFAGAFMVGRGLIGIVVVVVVVTAPRAVPLYPVAAAGAFFVMLDAGAFAGSAVRDIAGFESVLMVFGLAPASPSSAFLFSVGAPDEAYGLAVFATIVGLGFVAFVAEAGDFAAGAVADWPSLPTDASNAAN